MNVEEYLGSILSRMECDIICYIKCTYIKKHIRSEKQMCYICAVNRNKENFIYRFSIIGPTIKFQKSWSFASIKQIDGNPNKITV